MTEPTLLFGTAFSFVNAAIYFYVGWTLNRRRVVSSDARVAWKLFVVWWYALAGTSLAAGTLNLLGALGFASLPWFITVTQIELLVACLALYGLVYYLAYLFTGNTKVLTPLAVLYAVYYILLMYYLNLLVPTGVVVQKWNVTMTYQNQQVGGPLFILLVVLLVFPQIIGGVAYSTLFFRVKETTQKYRIALVSCSIVVWFLSAVLASAAGLSQYDWWQVASRVIGLGAPLATLMAYQPIGWIKQRLGVSSILEENA